MYLKEYIIVFFICIFLSYLTYYFKNIFIYLCILVLPQIIISINAKGVFQPTMYAVRDRRSYGSLWWAMYARWLKDILILIWNYHLQLFLIANAIVRCKHLTDDFIYKITLQRFYEQKRSVFKFLNSKFSIQSSISLWEKTFEDWKHV